MTVKGDQTRERILIEAARLFGQKGFHATSLSDILAATDLKKGALYFHFSSKDDIALAVLARARQEFADFLEKALSGSNPKNSLESFFTSLQNWHQEKGFVGGCIFGNTALEMGDTDERFSTFVSDVFEDWIARLRSVIEEAQLEGFLQNNLDAESLARHIVAVTEGGIMLDRLQKSDQTLTASFNTLRTFLFLETS